MIGYHLYSYTFDEPPFFFSDKFNMHCCKEHLVFYLRGETNEFFIKQQQVIINVIRFHNLKNFI